MKLGSLVILTFFKREGEIGIVLKHWISEHGQERFMVFSSGNPTAWFDKDSVLFL